jgi:hypothetical protein
LKRDHPLNFVAHSHNTPSLGIGEGMVLCLVGNVRGGATRTQEDDADKACQRLQFHYATNMTGVDAGP